MIDSKLEFQKQIDPERHENQDTIATELRSTPKLVRIESTSCC